MGLTDDQNKSFNGIKKLIEKEEQYAIISGQAGTGKTFLTKKLKSILSDSLSLITVTHKAKNVLSNSIGTTTGAMTYAKAMGLKQDIDKHGNIIFVPSKDPKIMDEHYIFDECSMLNQGMIENFESAVNIVSIEPFIIYIGDIHQLPPISDNNQKRTSDYVSPIFDRKNIFYLNEIIRQEQGNPIREVTKKIANEIDKPRKERDISIIKQFRSDFSHSDQKGVVVTNKRNDILKTYSNSFKKNVEFGDVNKFAITCYRNKAINTFNNEIRKHLGLKGEFAIGDIIIVSSNVMIDGELYIQNGEEFWIKELSSNKINDIDCWHMVLFRKPDIEREIDVVKFSSLKRYRDKKNEYVSIMRKAKGRQKFYAKQDLLNFVNQYVYVSFAHALTSYKIQGSTIDTVFADVTDVLNTSPIDTLTRLQSIYVATTRAQNRLVLF